MGGALVSIAQASGARFVVSALALLVVSLSGCSSKHYLMPTPNVYADREWDPFENVPEALQGDEIAVLYLTDRAVDSAPDKALRYGVERSRSMAFGESLVRIGDSATWKEIAAASRTAKRARALELRVEGSREIGRFMQVPPSLVIRDEQLKSGEGPRLDASHAEAEARFRDDLAERLALSPTKDVFIYVHGFNNSFEEAVRTTAELWHFYGREGVPVCYTWPAGMGGLRAYEYTLASTEFTIFHFKQALRLIASCPDVERVHIMAHSRGTQVTLDGLRELHIELRSTTDTQQALKIGTVVLAAADIDLDVMFARNAAERIGRATERAAFYVSQKDEALGLSSWLFGGFERVGEIGAGIFSPEEVATLRDSHRLQIIDAQVRRRGAHGHSYFHANPAVSSDLVLLMRFRVPPGERFGRPLGVSESGMWIVDDEYPGAEWTPQRIRSAALEAGGTTGAPEDAVGGRDAP